MTTKKFVEEMSQEELVKVFNANEKLQNEVLEDMIDSEMHWIGEKLDYVRDSLSDWSVGTCQRSYITVKKMNSFLQGLIEMDKSVPAFNDEKAAEVIGNLQKAFDAYYYAEVEEEDDLEELAEKAAQEAADELAAQFDRDLNYLYSHDAQLSYFLEFYADARMDDPETYYIIEEEETYKLYQDVSYTKSY
ncbi:hypothetical protein P59_239 [Bacillus phage P59]|nr:hypothetical protein P59_010 [Bacillus phage P59]QIW88836.1 hypothetical protein P59_239 [Bacillus phage P59]